MAKVTEHRVVNGDSPWKVAANLLKDKGSKVTNSQIIKEMNRLAKLNGCDSIEDFSSKFFSSCGKNVVVDKEIRETQSQKQIVSNNDSLSSQYEAVQDNTRVQKNDTLHNAGLVSTTKKNVSQKDTIKADTVPPKTIQQK